MVDNGDGFEVALVLNSQHTIAVNDSEASLSLRPSLLIDYSYGGGGQPPTGTDCSVTESGGVHQIVHNDGTTDLSPHQRSGDYQAFSSSSDWTVVRDWPNGNIYGVHLPTNACKILAPTQPEEFMWAPTGDQYWYIDEANSTLDLRHPSAPSVDITTVSLPATIAGPGSIGGASVTPDWRPGVASGDAIQFVTGYVFLNGANQSYYQSFDANTGQLLDGFWMEDASGGLATSGHNITTFNNGYTFTPSGPQQDFTHNVNFDGSGFVQVEPGTNPWSHESGNSTSPELVYWENSLSNFFGGIEIRNIDTNTVIAQMTQADVKAVT